MPTRNFKSVSLSPERLAILLALADRPLSAAQIADQVIADSVGSVSLHPGSHYRLIHELVARGYITDGPIYDLTPQGWRVLEHELPTAIRYVQLLQIRLSPRQYKAAVIHN
jgi:DNA-binding PadR family transcriptional regulator